MQRAALDRGSHAQQTVQAAVAGAQAAPVLSAVSKLEEAWGGAWAPRGVGCRVLTKSVHAWLVAGPHCPPRHLWYQWYRPVYVTPLTACCSYRTGKKMHRRPAVASPRVPTLAVPSLPSC